MRRATLQLAFVLEARQLASAQRLADRIVQSLGTGSITRKPKPYWKEAGQYTVSIAVNLDELSQAEGVLETLNLCSSVAYSWCVTCPDCDASGEWRFSGHASRESDKFKLSGICFASFDVLWQECNREPE